MTSSSTDLARRRGWRRRVGLAATLAAALTGAWWAAVRLLTPRPDADRIVPDPSRVVVQLDPAGQRQLAQGVRLGDPERVSDAQRAAGADEPIYAVAPALAQPGVTDAAARFYREHAARWPRREEFLLAHDQQGGPIADDSNAGRGSGQRPTFLAGAFVVALDPEPLPLIVLPAPARLWSALELATGVAEGDRAGVFTALATADRAQAETVEFAPGILSGRPGPAALAGPERSPPNLLLQLRSEVIGRIVGHPLDDVLGRAEHAIRLGWPLGMGAAEVRRSTVVMYAPGIWLARVIERGDRQSVMVSYPVSDGYGVARWTPLSLVDRERGSPFRNTFDVSLGTAASRGAITLLPQPLALGSVAQPTWALPRERICATEAVGTAGIQFLVVRRGRTWMPAGEDILIDNVPEFPATGDPREARAVFIFDDIPSDALDRLLNALVVAR